MQQMKVELLEKGDEVIGFSNDMLAVKKASGEVEIFKIDIDAKSEIASNARGTYVKGKQSKLPSRINEALALQNPERDDE